MTDAIQARAIVAPTFANAVRCLCSHFKNIGLQVPMELVADFERICNEYRDGLGEGETKLRIAVAGKFSSGKSQFINSLTGYNIAAVDLARTTCCKTIFTGDSSIKEVIISDLSGQTFTRDEYVELSAKKAASERGFIVRIPDVDWEDFEIVDTPGYDSADESDRRISESAVSEADVVLFLFDIGNGTIPKDSVEYLKRAVSQNQLLYLVANKADLKPERAREIIAKSIEEECLRNGVKYECVLPYSSLTLQCKEVLQKNEQQRTHVLNLAERLKVNLIEVVGKLVERSRQIKDAKASRLDAYLSDAIRQKWGRIADTIFINSIEKLSGCISEHAPVVDDVVEKVTTKLVDFASSFTSGISSKLIHWNEVSGTGIFWTNWQNDWRVSLGAPTDEYDWLGLESLVLQQDLMNEELGAYQLTEDITVSKLVDLIKSCSIEVINELSNKGGYSERCIVKSNCHSAEAKIQEKLNIEFPDAFYRVCRPKVVEIVASLNDLWLQKMVFKALKPVIMVFEVLSECLTEFDIEIDDSKIGILAEFKSREVVCEKNAILAYHAKDGAFVKNGDLIAALELENDLQHIYAPCDGKACFFVNTREGVSKGDTLAAIL